MPSPSLATVAVEASALLRRRLCDPTFVHTPFKSGSDSNYSKLKFIVSKSVTEACNNSVLLLGPRGCGKSAVLELVLEDVNKEHPGMISVIKLNGILHGDDNHGLKEIARQLCMEHNLSFSKMASSDENSQFLLDMLRECGLAHKTNIFVLEEFDLFTQGKQRVLYSLLDAMQSLTSQSVVIGLSCCLDADQLLEKRVRSRFSHRKLLFIPPSPEAMKNLMEHLLLLPSNVDLPQKYVREFNSRVHEIIDGKEFKEIINSVLNIDRSIGNLICFLFRSVSLMDLENGFLSLDHFKTASLHSQRQPKIENITNASIVELYILVCMNRLEGREQVSYNFNSILREYNSINSDYKTSDFYTHDVCLRAFEHLLESGLIGFTDSSSRNQPIEFRQVNLLISPEELYQGLKSYNSRPAILLDLFNPKSFK